MLGLVFEGDLEQRLWCVTWKIGQNILKSFFPLGLLNKKWDLRSQLDILQLLNSFGHQTFYMEYSEILH